MKASTVLVIVPVHNEAPHLERMLGPLLQVVRREGYDLIAIDDASTDLSPDILDRHGVAAIRLFENLGYGAALQTGYKYALAGGYEHLMQLDGDGQHDPRFLPMILRQLREHDIDIVIGSRFLPADPQPFAPVGSCTRAPRSAGSAFTCSACCCASWPAHPSRIRRPGTWA